MQKFVLLGERLGHSWSPLIHQQILESMGLQGEYLLREVDRQALAGEVETLRAQGVRGANVTIPYKQSILPQLDFVSPEARRIGAVNTIHFQADGKAAGYNTDYYGFLLMLRQAGIETNGRSALVLGAGGAACAAVAALLDHGAAVTVAGRDTFSLEKIKAAFPEVSTLSFGEIGDASADLLVNTTPVGMFPAVDDSPLAPQALMHFHAVADLIYNPTPTKLVRCAENRGMPACCGLYMLIHQAIKAQEIWQGQPAPEQIARQIYAQLIEKI